MKKKFLEIEIFPAILYDRKSLQGTIVFNFENRAVVIRSKREIYDLKVQDSSRGSNVTENYHPIELLIEVKDKEDIPMALIEKICDIISLATKCPWSYFASRIHEYQRYSHWGYAEVNIPDNIGLTINETKNIFIEKRIPEIIISAINKSSYKDRIYASIHLLRLSKYKKSTHLTEALTDCVNSIEALYMQENCKTGHQSEIDRSLIGNSNKNKTKALNYFIKKYYPANAKDLNFDLDKIYKIRSAYLHRGKLIERASGNIHWKLSKTEEDEIKIIERFCDIVFLVVLNFIVPLDMRRVSLIDMINQSEAEWQQRFVGKNN